MFDFGYFNEGMLMFGKKLSGVHAPHLKKTARYPSVDLPAPKKVTIPVSMHIGAPALPAVKPGDRVLVGQVIAEAGGAVSAPIHASVSGTVAKSAEYLAANGRTCQAIVIESDGLMEVSPEITPPEISDYDSFIKAVRNSGTVGLGGAGFPTSVKLGIGDVTRIGEIIVNGAECEPYITSDTRTMTERADEVAFGCELLKKYLSVKKIYIGIEKNKPEAISEMKRISEEIDGVEVKVLPSLYPQGGEKVLIYNITGKTVPSGKLPIDVGTVVINVTTLAEIARYVKTGMPLVTKCVTVDGRAVKTPKNVRVPIGTPISDLFDFCDGFSSEPEKIIFGGLMMGSAAYSLDMPVTKTTNAVLALDKKEATPPPTTACIRCGRCIASCPFSLDPPAISAAYAAKDASLLAKLAVSTCMECGCCGFICPAGRPIVQTNKLAKVFLTEENAKKKGV